MYMIGENLYREGVMRRTTIELDEELLADAQQVLGTHGVKDTVETALTAAVAADARRRFFERMRTMDGMDPWDEAMERRAWGRE